MIRILPMIPDARCEEPTRYPLAYIASSESRFHAGFEAIRKRYLERWSPPEKFEWCDLRYDVLSPDIVNVLGYFNWTGEKESTQMSYVGTLQKVDGIFRIRLEVESEVPESARSPQCPK